MTAYVLSMDMMRTAPHQLCGCPDRAIYLSSIFARYPRTLTSIAPLAMTSVHDTDIPRPLACFQACPAIALQAVPCTSDVTVVATMQ